MISELLSWPHLLFMAIAFVVALFAFYKEVDIALRAGLSFGIIGMTIIVSTFEPMPSAYLSCPECHAQFEVSTLLLLKLGTNLLCAAFGALVQAAYSHHKESQRVFKDLQAYSNKSKQSQTVNM